MTLIIWNTASKIVILKLGTPFMLFLEMAFCFIRSGKIKDLLKLKDQ